MGARALTKHAIRSSEKFWGNSIGNEAEKNHTANELLHKVLDNCIWVSVHTIPPKVEILEIRIAEGYGMRWSIDGKFRGFLEPPMEDGHDAKWRH